MRSSQPSKLTSPTLDLGTHLTPLSSSFLLFLLFFYFLFFVYLCLCFLSIGDPDQSNTLPQAKCVSGMGPLLLSDVVS